MASMRAKSPALIRSRRTDVQEQLRRVLDQRIWPATCSESSCRTRLLGARLRRWPPTGPTLPKRLTGCWSGWDAAHRARLAGEPSVGGRQVRPSMKGGDEGCPSRTSTRSRCRPRWPDGGSAGRRGYLKLLADELAGVMGEKGGVRRRRRGPWRRRAEVGQRSSARSSGCAQRRSSELAVLPEPGRARQGRPAERRRVRAVSARRRLEWRSVVDGSRGPRSALPARERQPSSTLAANKKGKVAARVRLDGRQRLPRHGRGREANAKGQAAR